MHNAERSSKILFLGELMYKIIELIFAMCTVHIVYFAHCALCTVTLPRWVALEVGTQSSQQMLRMLQCGDPTINWIIVTDLI